jgi:hypothetical protein
VDAQAAHRWCAAVNATAEFGRWDYELAYSMREFGTALLAVAPEHIQHPSDLLWNKCSKRRGRTPNVMVGRSLSSGGPWPDPWADHHDVRVTAVSLSKAIGSGEMRCACAARQQRCLLTA